MTAAAVDVVSEPVRVDDLNAGDEVYVLGTPRVVSRVESYDDGTYVVVYFSGREHVFENKATNKSGWNIKNRLVELSLCPMRIGNVVLARRGTPTIADELRAHMLREQQRRFDQQ